MKILQLTYRVPYPPTDGGSIGIYNIVKGLHENNCEIDLVSINTPKHSQPKECMTQFASQYDVFVDTRISLFKLLKNVLFQNTPYNVERFFAKQVEDQLEELLKKNVYDFIQLEGTFVLKYVDLIRKLCEAPVIVRAHNIEYVIWDRLSKNESNLLKKLFYVHLTKRLKRFEREYYNKADAIAAITNEDKIRLKNLNVHVQTDIIPAGVVLDNYLNANEENSYDNTLFFLGALDWLPNIEGLNWFIDSVWPKVLEAYPQAKLHIAGKAASEHLINSNIQNATIHGFVDDAVRFMKNYNVMLVPLLSGGGMRVKIVEGFAAGKCIISTRIGAEGIICSNNKNIVIADTPEEWKNAIVKCLSQVEFRHKIESEALYTASKYDNRSVTKKYIELFQKIMSSNKNINSTEE